MRSSTTTCGGPRESEGPFAACAEGVEIGGRFMGCVPFLAKEMGTTMGPATGLLTLQRASVTVARLCRILTGFADPLVLSSVGRASVRLFTLAGLTRDKWEISEPEDDARCTAADRRGEPRQRPPAKEVADAQRPVAH